MHILPPHRAQRMLPRSSRFVHSLIGRVRMLAEVDLSAAEVTADTLTEFLAACAESHSLAALTLEHCRIDSTVAAAFQSILAKSESLTALTLGHATITSEEAGRALADGIRCSRALQSLHLPRATIDDAVSIRLIDAVAESATLHTVDFACAQFGAAGRLALSTRLLRSRALTHVDLTSSLSMNGAFTEYHQFALQLTASIDECNHARLLHIEFGGRYFGDHGCAALLRALRRCAPSRSPRVLRSRHQERHCTQCTYEYAAVH
jgi:hypothetical protein